MYLTDDAFQPVRSYDITYITVVQHLPKVLPKLGHGILKFRDKRQKSTADDGKLAVACLEKNVGLPGNKPDETADVVREVDSHHHLPPRRSHHIRLNPRLLQTPHKIPLCLRTEAHEIDIPFEGNPARSIRGFFRDHGRSLA